MGRVFFCTDAICSTLRFTWTSLAIAVYKKRYDHDYNSTFKIYRCTVLILMRVQLQVIMRGDSSDSDCCASLRVIATTNEYDDDKKVHVMTITMMKYELIILCVRVTAFTHVYTTALSMHMHIKQSQISIPSSRECELNLPYCQRRNI
jgi:hypothetical protein